MDMSAMHAAGLQNIDPHAVESEPFAPQIEIQQTRKARDVDVDPLLQIRKFGRAQRQIIERGIGCLAAIGMLAGPTPPG